MKVESHSIEERYVFSSNAKKILAIIIVVGIVLFGLGCFQAANQTAHEEGHGKSEASHHKSEVLIEPIPGHSAGESIILKKEHEKYGKHSESKESHVGFGAEKVTSEKEETQHEGYHWTKRLYVNLWTDNVFFIGIAIVGIFFYALQFAASAGWSAGLKRVPLAFGHWLPIGAVLMLIIFFLGQHDIFHWTHESLYDKNSPEFDEILDGKRGYLNTPFFLIRTIIYFVVWIGFFLMLNKEAKAEDLDGDTRHYVRSKWISAFFIIFFAVSNSTSSWDWMMSTDPHWFSTMFGWFYFAALFVTTLAVITLFVVYLKEQGYLSIVNENHLHDLGKFVFAFSIFYTYIWFGQFFLIYYANIPEEAAYYVERLNNMKFAPVFYAVLFLNFVFPFLLFMTRDSKRQMIFLKIVCPMVIVGQWINFWLISAPPTLQENAGLGFMEIGMVLIFGGAFVMVTLAALTRLPLIAKHHPMLEESIHHHI